MHKSICFRILINCQRNNIPPGMFNIFHRRMPVFWGNIKKNDLALFILRWEQHNVSYSAGKDTVNSKMFQTVFKKDAIGFLVKTAPLSHSQLMPKASFPDCRDFHPACFISGNPFLSTLMNPRLAHSPKGPAGHDKLIEFMRL